MNKKIFNLTKHVRETIEKNKDFWVVKNDHGFSRFPADCCDATSEILLKYLSENWIDGFNFVYKTITYKNKEHPHVWLENDYYALDITWDQFNEKIKDIPFEKIIFVRKEEYFFNQTEGEYLEYKQRFLESSHWFFDYQSFYNHFLMN